jgi:hypothetical protein
LELKHTYQRVEVDSFDGAELARDQAEVDLAFDHGPAAVGRQVAETLTA